MEINYLQKVKIFAELTTEELTLISHSLKSVSYKANEVIFQEDSAGNELFLLFQGKVCISKKMALVDQDNNINKTLTTLIDKDYPFFGEVGLLGKQLRTATVTAITDCKLYSIDHDRFMKIIQQNPHIGVVVLLEISTKLAMILEKADLNILKLTTALIYALN
ncbi:MAG: cyclic nucleotide-binding domain-containing protein [Candidatus Cloacimonadales bacterium]